jgi:multicomponent Na+:H+ antiporter subunit D
MLMTGKRTCSELGGLFRTMPLTTACATIGVLAVSAFPFTSGFISKSMVSQAALDGHHLWIWLLLTTASAGVFLHAGLKFLWFVFFQKDAGLRPAEPPASMRWAMVFFSVLCIALGVWPEPLYALLPYAVNYVPYTGAHVVTQLQLLLFSGLAFFVLLPYLKPGMTITLDTDWVWRILLPALMRKIGLPLVKGWNMLVQAAYVLITESMALVLYQHRQDGRFARTWSTRSMALWVLVLLLGFLILYYV